jgi:chemotaxis receptor (MCP) glutamine deamidase CheD
MNITLESRSRPVQHCGVVYHLLVKSDLPPKTTPKKTVSKKAHLLGRNRISLYIGEVAASQSPVLLDTLLGSCVAVCLYDPVLRIGGMNHILLPKCQAGDKSPRCGVHAMELLINELMKLGGEKKRFIAKAFGGANIFPGMKMSPVGEENAIFVRQFLATEKIPLVSERMGGNHAVRLYFHTDTGKAYVHTVDGSSLPKIIKSESCYCKPTAGSRPIGDDITLF